jgi:hypothetical protein
VVSECDGESSIMRRPWPTGGGGAVGNTKSFLINKKYFIVLYILYVNIIITINNLHYMFRPVEVTFRLLSNVMR